jgi:hypothetical protein
LAFTERLDQRAASFQDLSETLLEFEVNASGGTNTCTIETWEHSRRLLLDISTTLEVASSRIRHAVAYIALVNQRLALGRFELVLFEERLHLRVGVDDVRPEQFTASRANRMVGLSVQAMDRYLPGLKAVFRGVLPASAFIEADVGPS